MTEIISGIAAAAGLIFITAVQKKYFTVKLFAAANLTAIAFIYVGFVLKDNTAPYMVLEILMAIAFLLLSIIGYSYKNCLLGYGIILHGVWDMLHHNGWFINTNMPVYWPVFCLTIDFIYGLYLVYVFKKQPAIV